MRHASLFSGIGGFDLAAEWAGWTNVFNCDIEPFARTILKHHFPNAIQYDDVKSTDFSIHAGQIDVLTGGFPCQPFSTAGKRLGKNDERHLWPYMFRAIQQIRPRWIVGENVRGLLSWNDGMVLDEVYADLEAEGYEVLTFVLPAAGINAPHKRDRVWIIASHTNNAGARESMPTDGEWSQNDEGRQGQSQPKLGQGGSAWLASDTKLHGCPSAQGGSGHGEDCEWCQEGPHSPQQSQGVCESQELGAIHENTADTTCERCGRRHRRSQADQREEWTMDQDQRQHPDGVRCKAEGCCADAPNASAWDSWQGMDTTSWCCQCNLERGEADGSGIVGGQGFRTGIGEEGSETCGNIQEFRNARWNATDTEGQRLKASRNEWEGMDSQEGSWIYGGERDARAQRWTDFPTQPPVCGGNDGIPDRLDGITVSKWRRESIKAYGNAIVPQIAYRIFQSINKMENL